MTTLAETVNAEMSLAVAIEDLREVADHIPDRSRDFAASLVAQYAIKGRLSEKQIHWVGKLTQEARDIAEGNAPAGAKVQKDAFPGIATVFQWFENVEGKLRYPKVSFLLEDGKVLRIKVAKGGRYPGALTLTDDGQYPDNEFYGWVKPNGEWVQSRETDRAEIIQKFLTGMSDDPVGYVREYGHQSGNCCFCSRGLTQEASVEAGYGPVCADKWGLPWGSKG